MAKSNSKLTQSVHAGSLGDSVFGGVTTPIFPSSAYDFEEVVRYPRYSNTPNQLAAAQKMAALENGEDALMFSSGMAAICTTLLTFLRQGDHAIFQNDLYGGTHVAVVHELEKFGIGLTMVNAADPDNFRKAIRKETKLIYVETPSNPLLKITDLKAVAGIAKKHGLITIIDNTFASPVNQNPLDLGIDIVAHSGTKYIGGHSDLTCGVAVASKKLIDSIRGTAKNYGGMLDPFVCYLVERSLKTIVLRVERQNQNALKIAQFMAQEAKIGAVYYPGLKTHEGYATAKKQMPGGFGGMLSFEVKGSPDAFLKKLKLIKRAISLGGVESTISSPVKTSHSKLTATERKSLGISDKLLRLSVGIEASEDLIQDLKGAIG